jgi:ATP-dependent DNA helicase RecQ
VKRASAPKKRTKRELAGVEIDDALFERLRELRRTIAAEQSVPAYVVFGDASLIDMAVRHPRTPEEFLEVHGVGVTKLARYGEAFLEELR